MLKRKALLRDHGARDPARPPAGGIGQAPAGAGLRPVRRFDHAYYGERHQRTQGDGAAGGRRGSRTRSAARTRIAACPGAWPRQAKAPIVAHAYAVLSPASITMCSGERMARASCRSVAEPGEQQRGRGSHGMDVEQSPPALPRTQRGGAAALVGVRGVDALSVQPLAVQVFVGEARGVVVALRPCWPNASRLQRPGPADLLRAQRGLQRTQASGGRRTVHCHAPGR